MTPGIYPGMSNAAYHADRSCIGASGLKAILKSPAFYFGQYLDPECPPEPETESPGRRFGNMVHCHLFEPATFSSRYKVGPDCARNLKQWKDWAASNLDDTCEGIKPAEYKAMQRVRRSVLEIPDMAKALADGQGEVSAAAVDPDTGVLVKVRPDWVHPVGDAGVILVDGKTYATADEADFPRQAAAMQYHLQDALYSDTYERASGKKVLGFVFLLIADKWPHCANAVMLDEESREAGRREYKRGLALYAECQRTGIWPGHGEAIKLVTLPAWAKGVV